MAMIAMTETVSKRKVTALLFQPIGRDGAMVYRVYWQDDSGRERNYETTPDEFWQIQNDMGPASYTEPGYWTYEVVQ